MSRNNSRRSVHILQPTLPGLTASRRVTSWALASTSTVGKLASITSVTGASSKCRFRTTWANARFSLGADRFVRLRVPEFESTPVHSSSPARRKHVGRRNPNQRAAHSRPLVPLIKPGRHLLRFQQTLLLQPLVRMMLGQIMFAGVANDEDHQRVFVQIPCYANAAARFVPLEPPQKIPSIRPSCRDISNDSPSVMLITSSTYWMCTFGGTTSCPIPSTR